MEGLIESGMAAGVLDVTTTEWADELVGGILSAGKTRLDAAKEAGVPAVIAPGCLDMVNFGEPESVPARFAGRRFYRHNPQVTLMRTTPAECAELGRILAEKINAYRAPTTVLFPAKGLSAIGEPGQPFWDPDADAALLAALQSRSPRRRAPGRARRIDQRSLLCESLCRGPADQYPITDRRRSDQRVCRGSTRLLLPAGCRRRRSPARLRQSVRAQCSMAPPCEQPSSCGPTTG